MYLYHRVIAALGEENQMIQLFEELCELGLAVCKWRRKQASAEDVTTEIADVLIMIEQVMIIIGISAADVMQEKRRKLERLEKRLDKYECTKKADN